MFLVILQGGESLGSEDDDGDDIDPCHQPYSDVAQGPDCVGLFNSPENHRTKDNDLKDPDKDFLDFRGETFLECLL